jgi:hypothetical protein
MDELCTGRETAAAGHQGKVLLRVDRLRNKGTSSLTDQLLSPFEVSPPSGKRLLTGIAAAMVAAAVVLVVAVLPAEYGIDPTHIGRASGLTAMHEPNRMLQVKDVVGGNESYKDVKIPDAGQPVPLPNPAVSQLKTVDSTTRTMKVTLQPSQETEVKAILDEAQVILYSWQADGDVYTDFHGHEPSAGDAFVRYEEQQSGRSERGSLVAPFSGEHGWYWVNISEKPVTITLVISGYFKDIKDYGIIR